MMQSLALSHTFFSCSFIHECERNMVCYSISLPCHTRYLLSFLNVIINYNLEMLHQKFLVYSMFRLFRFITGQSKDN